MARQCSFHPTVDASMTCGLCGSPLCAECTHIIGVVPACARCAPSITARQNRISGSETAQQQAEDPYPLRRLLYSQPDPVVVQEQAQEQSAPSHNTNIGGRISSAFGSLFGSAGRSAKR